MIQSLAHSLADMDVEGPAYVHRVDTSKGIAAVKRVVACGHSYEEGTPCTVVSACWEAQECKKILVGVSRVA